MTTTATGEWGGEGDGGGGGEEEEVCLVVLVIVISIIHSNNTYFPSIPLLVYVGYRIDKFLLPVTPLAGPVTETVLVM